MSSQKMLVKTISAHELMKILEKIIMEFDCSYDEIYEHFSKCYIYEIIGEKFSQISLSTSDFSNIINVMSKIGLHPYMIGTPILRVTKSKKIFPLLPLGNILTKYCKKIIRLNENLINKIIYGKTIEINDKIGFNRVIIVNKYGEFIAYAKIKREKNYTLIIPELDIGWYLRKGG
jgi:ribosome biogenesis protein Nip4